MVHIAAFDPNSETKKYWNEVQLRFQPMYSHWNWAGKDSVRLYTFSNCQEVELFINGKSQGIKKIPDVYYTKKITSYSAEEYDPDAPINVGPAMHKQLEWIVPYQPGKIVAVSRINGKEVARHEMVTAGAPHAIVLEPDRTVIKADGLDLSYITVKIVDKNGVPMQAVAAGVKIEVTGENWFDYCLTSYTGKCSLTLPQGAYQAYSSGYDQYYECNAAFGCPKSFNLVGSDTFVSLTLQLNPNNQSTNSCSDTDGGLEP